MHRDTALLEAVNSVRCFMRLVEYGVPFPTDGLGRFIGYQTDHDASARGTSAGPLTSKYMTEALERRVRENPDVRILDRTTVIRVVTEHNRAVGVVCLSPSANGGAQLFPIRADDIILATGGAAGVYADSVYPLSQSGALGLAVDAGCTMNNLTEWQYGIASKKVRWNLSGSYQQVIPSYYSVDQNGVRRNFLADRFDTASEMCSAIFLKGYQWPFDSAKTEGSTKVGNGTTWRTLSSLSYNSAGLMSKQTYGNGDYIDFTYDSLDRITEKKYNGSSTRRATYAYGADGSLARSTDFSTGTTTKYVYDLADRLVGVREYTGTSISARALRASTDYIYADKTNYLIGMRHFSPLGTQTVDYTYGDITEGQMPDQVYSVKWNGEEKLSYTYDPLGRLSARTLHVTGNVENIPQLTTQYSYVNVGENRTTTMVQSVSTMGVTHNYTYDAVGNIQSIQLGSDVTSYEYDSLNQLVRVNDPYLNRTVTYEYENGNITFEHTYAYTTGDLPATPMYSTQYHYDDPVWRDVLTGSSYLRYNQNTANTASACSADAAAEDDAAATLAESVLGENFHAVELTENDLFGGTEAAGASAFGAQTASAQASNSAVVESTSTIQSDEIGNIIDVDGMEFVWEGRQLQSIGANGTPYFSYEYNIDGQRTKKTVTDFDTGEATTTEYFYNSGMLMGQKTGNDVLVFMYDESGGMFGFTYNGAPYYYVKNAQNDVWAVTNADGQAVVLYFYDAWGDVAKRYVADGYDAIAQINPILYRSC